MCEDLKFLEEGVGCPGGPTQSPSQCSAGYVEPSCPSGYDELAAAHLCTSSTQQEPPLFFTDPVGVVTMGKEIESRTTPPSLIPVIYQCGTGACQALISCGGSNYQRHEAYATFNGAKIGSFQCWNYYQATRIVFSASFGVPPSCAPGSATNELYPTSGLAQARTKVCCRRSTPTP